MDDQAKQQMARALLGQGMAGQAADEMRMNPLQKQWQISTQTGETNLPFDQWLQQQQATQMMGTAP